MVQSYDDLSRKLWRLEGLPLSITSVQGAHPALRYTQVNPLINAVLLIVVVVDMVKYIIIILNTTAMKHQLTFVQLLIHDSFDICLNCVWQVFPPVPLKLDYSFFDREKTCRSLVPKEGKPCPAYITPITG